jgi:hypothetical protein
MKIYTIDSGRVSDGATVSTATISNGEIKIPVIQVGETGRGRKLAYVPISLLPENYKNWQETGRCQVSFVNLGKTKAGSPKFFETAQDESPEKFVGVFPTKIGFRGSNYHTGDRVNMEEQGNFHEFPGEIIAQGQIAQGAAGNMGWGSQLIAIMPYQTVFRTAYGGRLYGNPGSHYYFHDGTKLFATTWEDRIASDLF